MNSYLHQGVSRRFTEELGMTDTKRTQLKLFGTRGSRRDRRRDSSRYMIPHIVISENGNSSGGCRRQVDEDESLQGFKKRRNIRLF